MPSLRETFEFEVINCLSLFIPHVFESIFAKIYLNDKDYVILGSIYRPNTGPLLLVNSWPKSLKLLNVIKNSARPKKFFLLGI